jgi:diguanylate cyclase (GGDEF)-like protein
VFTLLGVTTYFQRWGWELWALLPAAVLTCIEIGLVFTGGENYRVMVPLGAGARAIVTIATAITLWRWSDEASRLAARSSSLFHLAWAAILTLRIGWWLTHPSAGQAADPTSTFGLLSRLLLTWAITPTYLWMLTRELDAELIRHARQDPLTGIPNRRVIWAEGQKWAETRDRKGRYMAVVIIDIDHFKAVNDNWGHAVGDDVLVGVAHTLARHMREEDLLARIGGEEFMVLSRHEHRDLTKAMSAIEAMAERLRQAIEKQEFSILGGERLKCTASIGYAVSQRGQSHWSTVVEAADKALYAAKRNGRNQVRGCSSQPN